MASIYAQRRDPFLWPGRKALGALAKYNGRLIAGMEDG